MSVDPDAVIQLDGSIADPIYRAIRFDAQGGVASTEAVAARTDDEALAAVRAMGHRGGTDLWDRNRLVASLQPAEPEPSI